MESYRSILLIPFLSLLLFHSFALSVSTLSPEPSPAPFSPNAEASNELESELGPELESQLKAELESLESVPSSEHHDRLLFGRIFTNPLINNVCHKTDYPALCISTIAPALGPGRSDIYGIIGKAIEATSVVTRKGLRRARRLATKPGTPPDVAGMLRRCRQTYRESLDSVQEAMTAFTRRDFGRMSTMLSSVITNVGDCADEFSGQPSPMAVLNDRVTKMTSNCLAMAEVIDQFHI